jgi:hypothetical protein
MSAEKLSVSMESSLVKVIRSAASDAGVSLSTWLADAARAKARQVELRDALAHYAKAHGEISTEEATRIVAVSRKRSIVTGIKKRRP